MVGFWQGQPSWPAGICLLIASSCIRCLFLKGDQSHQEAPLSQPHLTRILSKAPPPNPTTSGVRASIYRFEGTRHIQSTSLNECGRFPALNLLLLMTKGTGEEASRWQEARGSLGHQHASAPRDLNGTPSVSYGEAPLALKLPVSNVLSEGLSCAPTGWDSLLEPPAPQLQWGWYWVHG